MKHSKKAIARAQKLAELIDAKVYKGSFVADLISNAQGYIRDFEYILEADMESRYWSCQSIVKNLKFGDKIRIPVGPEGTDTFNVLYVGQSPRANTVNVIDNGGTVRSVCVPTIEDQVDGGKPIFVISDWEGIRLYPEEGIE